MIKSHEEHQSLISSCIYDIHTEFDGIFKVLVEDRSYGTSAGRNSNVQAQTVDLPHIRKLFDSLLNSLTILQTEAKDNSKKKVNKALASNPCGFVNVEEVASVPLRLLRVNSTSNPKQARADKRLYDELINSYLAELHCLAWKVLGFLFKNVEMGTEVFERELAVLVRDLIKSDLKTMDSLGKGSECALNHFNELLKSSTSFNGQIFVCDLISSGILIEISTKSLKSFAALLRSGPNTEKLNGNSGNKKARYHQASESDQKRLQTAQTNFIEELDRIFSDLLRTFGVFESSQGHLSPQDHVTLSENVLTTMALLFQSQHNYKFVPRNVNGEYLRLLVTSLSVAMVSFQPAYLPPFLPLAMRLLASVAGRSDGAGLAARKALLQVELIIHPRRNGPVTYRPASEAVKKVFERPEPEVQVVELNENLVILDEKQIEGARVVEAITPVIIEPVMPTVPLTTVPNTSINTDVSVPIPITTTIPTIITTTTAAEPVPLKANESVNLKANEMKSEERQSVPPVAPMKRTAIEDDDDDEPMPQIVESGPDDN